MATGGSHDGHEVEVEAEDNQEEDHRQETLALDFLPRKVCAVEIPHFGGAD
jgi:hypothetical protein